MAKTDFRTVQDYLDTLPTGSRAALETVRAAILAGVPDDVEEVISYQIPAVKSHGWVFYYSAHAKHYSLSCPPPWTVFDEFAEQLAPYPISKSTIRFPLDEPVPTDLITAMARFRAGQNLATEQAKKAK